MKLNLNRDFSRFLNDPTFPYKVTVCIGDERILCSGALLAQQSSVLEKKFREDDGVLIFEEMVDVDNKNQGLHECIRFLHGSDVQFTPNDFSTILKFSSLYEITNLFIQASQWLRNHLDSSKSVEDAIKFLKISNCFHKPEDTERIKSEIKHFIRSNRDIFGLRVIEHLDVGVTAFDIITIINEKLVNSAQILSKWASLSMENRSFVINNHSSFDLICLFPNEDEFSAFMSLLSEGTASVESVQALLNLQKSFFTLKRAKFPEPLEVPSSSGLNLNISPASLFAWDKAFHGESVSNVHLGSKSHTLVSDTTTRVPSPCHQEIVDVWYLPPSTSKGKLKQLFAFAGRIKSIKMFFENAVVTFEDQASANRLLKHNSEYGFILDGYRLSIDATFDVDVWNTFKYTSEKVVISNIPHSISKTKLQKLFSYAGVIMSIDIFREDFHAVITYENVASASTVRASGRDFYIGNFLLCVFSEESEIEGPREEWENDDEFNETELYIGNIPNNAKESALKQMLSGYGKVLGLNIIKDNHSNYGFVRFQKLTSARNLLRNSRNRNFTYEGNILEIDRVQKN